MSKAVSPGMPATSLALSSRACGKRGPAAGPTSIHPPALLRVPPVRRLAPVRDPAILPADALVTLTVTNRSPSSGAAGNGQESP